jgi:hypothetical protein
VFALIWLTSKRDLGWRKRRLIIAVAGTTLAFALTLLLSGFRHGIDVEADRTVRALGADVFIVRDGVSGPFTTIAQLPDSTAEDVRRVSGVLAADAIVSVRHSIESEPITTSMSWEPVLVGSACPHPPWAGAPGAAARRCSTPAPAARLATVYALADRPSSSSAS